MQLLFQIDLLNLFGRKDLSRMETSKEIYIRYRDIRIVRYEDMPNEIEAHTEIPFIN